MTPLFSKMPALIVEKQLAGAYLDFLLKLRVLDLMYMTSDTTYLYFLVDNSVIIC
jgi:hypothetical protein